MRTSVYIVAICAFAATLAAPAPAPHPAPQPAAINDQTPEIIEIIAPANSAQETLATLNLGAPGSELSERNKRTIGILRQLFPTLTQIIEQKVQQLTSMILSTFGPVILRTFLGGGRSAGGDANTGRGGGTIELDDDDDDDDDAEPLTSAPTSSTVGVSESTTTPAPTTEADADAAPSASASASASAEAEAEAEAEERRRRRKRALFFLPNGIGIEENQLLSGAESQQAEVRVAFGDAGAGGAQSDQQAAAAAADQAVAASEDQQSAAQSSIDEISLDDADDSEENRNKRFLSFGGQGGSSGGGGGSGNFLFDIVRRAPEAMARAAGTAYRLFAGTDSLNLGLTASHTGLASLDAIDSQLVAGSSSGSQADAGVDGDDGAVGAGKGDNLTEGVPGPITRLFIIANRGIANLIQDLILRIAQTSERIVNFKARLITSII